MATSREKTGRKSKWDTPAPSPVAATEAAHEAARKLNAMLAAKGKLNTNATPPLLPPPGPRSTAGPNKDSNTNSEVFSEEIEINDSPQRLVLCKSTVQFEISKYSGASISTKGQYIPAAEKDNFPGLKPLYLFIQSSTRDQVNVAVQRINGILQGDDPHSAPPLQPFQQSSPLPSGMHYVQDKLFVGLDNVPPDFNLKEKIVGPSENYFNHISRETGAKIQLRGRGSGFFEPTSGREAFEALYIYISHTTYPGLGAAKKLVENLIQTVTQAFHAFQMQQQPSNNFYPGYGTGHGSHQQQHRPMYMPQHVQRYDAPPNGPHPNGPHLNGPHPDGPHPNGPHPDGPHPNGPHPDGPRPNGPPSYPPYPHRPSQYPPRYNRPPQPRPDQHHHGQQQPPRGFYQNQAPPFQEGPRPLMNELVPRPSYPRDQGGFHPSHPQEPPQTNNNIPGEHYPSYEREPSGHVQDNTPHSADSRKRRFAEAKHLTEQVGLSEKTPDIDPPKRRFTEVPSKQPHQPTQPSNIALEKRSVSSLDRPSSSFSSSQQPSQGDQFVMPAPPPKVIKRTLKDDMSPGGFKAPLLPVRLLPASAAHKTFNAPVYEKKPKVEAPATKSAGFALLGHYGDSSDEDD